MQKFSFKRLTAWMLTILMVVSVAPVSVYADAMDAFLGDITEYFNSKGDPLSALGASIAAGTGGNTIEVEEAYGESAMADGTPVVVIAGSDYQASSSDTTMKNIISQIKKNYSSIDGVLMGGDYNGGSTTYSSATEVAAVDTTITNAGVSTSAERIYVQGNHDTNLSPSDSGNLLATTGAHDTASYGVYAINYEDFGSAASGLETYLKGKSGYTKPIFVITHQPLHKTTRNDNNTAVNIFNVLNSYEDLNIIFLFGHNHSGGYDAYLGNGSIYLPKGSSITVAGGSTSTLNFTYMNCGYVGYVNGSADKTLTMSAFEITDTQVAVKRYDASGLHNLKAAGATVSGYNTDSNIYGTAVIDLSTGESATYDLSADSGSDGSTGSGTTGGSTETVVGNGTYTTADDGSYQKVTFGSTTTEKKTVYVLTDTLTQGKNYLIVSANTAGSGNAFEYDNTSGETVTINAATTETGAVYIETSNTALVWQYNSSSRFYNEANGGYLRIRKNEVTVTTSTDNASTVGMSGNCIYRQNDDKYFCMYYGSSGWDSQENRSIPSSSTYNVYIYQEKTVDITTGSSVTYSVTASDIEHFYTADTTGTETAKITASVTDGTPTGTYAYAIVGGDDIITSIDQSTGVITLNGNEGTAQVKVSYTWTEGENTYTIWQVIDVTATSPYYTLDIMKGDDVVSGTTVAIKGVTANQTMQLGTQITLVSEDGPETLDSLPEGAVISWHIPEEYQTIATINHDTGLVTFKGVSGSFYVTADLTLSDGSSLEVSVNISATTSQYSIPEDGTTDFPEYPNEGAIRFDKTATAVGNFSETGITQIELSMTGVPYIAGSEIDVVLMLDRSTSMNSDRIAATVAATKAFVKGIVQNEDGSYNGNRIYIGYFMGKNAYDITSAGNIGGTLASVDNDTEFNALMSDIDSQFTRQSNNYGTDWQIGLERCEDLLGAAKKDGIGNDRQQFCVFMSDGAPGDYRDLNDNEHSLTSGSNWVTNNSRNSDYKYELYSTRMKGEENITIYSVLLGEEAIQPQFLMNDLSGPAGETTNDTGSALSKLNTYYYLVPDANSADNMEDVFQNIAQKILQAATDITVEDKITDEYTMIFDIPTGSHDITGVTNDFYIEFGKYALDENHERTTYTSVTKVYLTNTNDVLSAKDATDPVFEQKTIGDKGTLYYWSTNASDGDADVSVTVDGNTYYFVSYGMETAGYNMTSGGYAYGTVNSENMSTDLVIATPYFVYNAATKMLYWTVDKLDTAEYALRYFLYLDRSATEVGTAKEVPAGTYYTNDHAYITYTNFRGNDCRQEFDKPQMTWNGAQVSYVFYLVNADGTPINRSGQVVDFANATFITDVYTESVVWNKAGDTTTGTGQLSANWLADDLLPEEYEIYDEQARYVLNVYENADGTTILNQFKISGNNAAAISSSLNTRLGLNTTESTVSTKTTKVYNTKAGEKISNYGTYTSADSNMNGFDFANTTVAFAVVWQPRLVEDTVVVDYGLDVLINVVENDILQNTVSGIGLGKEAYGNIAMNTGVSTDAKFGKAAQTTGQGATISIENETSIRYHQNDMIFSGKDVFYYESPVEFWEGSNPKEGYMYSSVTVIPATSIYYEESFMTFKNTDGSEWPETNSGYGFWNQVQDDNYKSNPTQSQDRPGESQISGSLDADNIYGYDPAYDNYTIYSLGQAMKVNVDSKTGADAVAPTVSFTFKGTGFDVVSMTDNTSGAIAVNVDKINTDGTITKDFISTSVDNYYGYTYKEYAENIKVVKSTENLDKTTEVVYYKNGEEVVEYSVYLTIGSKERCIVDGNTTATTLNVTRYAWEETKETTDNNAIYQVPVIKIDCEEYAEYQVTIKLLYFGIFDHVKDNDYTFVMDAVRIYDPANSGKGDDTIKDAYEADGEYMPVYLLIKDSILSSTISVDGSTQLDGTVFIDGMNGTSSIDDYTNPGPNNEAYLANGQSISFKLKAVYIPQGMAIDQVHIGMKLAYGEEASVKVVDNVDNVERVQTLKTATDMYYDLDVSWNENNTSNDIQITNTTEGAVISLTNVKVTFKSTADTASDSGENNFSSGVNTVETDNVPVVQFLTDNEVVENALLLKKESAPEAPVFTPETFEVEVTRNRSGNNETVTVKTSADVETITINGIEVTKFKEVKGERTWTYKPKKADIADQYEVVAYNAEGLASATVYAVYEAGEANLGKFHFSNLFSKDFESGYNVFDAFHGYGNNAYAEKMMAVMEKLAARFFKPEKLQMNYQEQADGNSMLVVNTSEDVEYIVADGEIVNNFITETIIDLSKDGEETVNRVWLVPDADENAEVAAYNAEGVACNAENN